VIRPRGQGASGKTGTLPLTPTTKCGILKEWEGCLSIPLPPTLKMELTKSFPPADALVAKLQKIEYRKIANQIITVAMFAAAIAQVLFERAQAWWMNGGKEQAIKVVDFVTANSEVALNAVNQWFTAVVTPWVQTVAIPNTISFAKEVENTVNLVTDNFVPTLKL